MVGPFTEAHLKKAQELTTTPLCTICKKPVDIVQVCFTIYVLRVHSVEYYLKKPLESSLCTTDNCTAVSHLTCLATSFIEAGGISTDMMPRGGNCRSCGTYTMWGDIIRGCYRRQAGGAIVTEEDEEASEEELNAAVENETTDDASEDDIQPAVPIKSKVSSKTATGKPKGRPKSRLKTSQPKSKYHTKAHKVCPSGIRLQSRLLNSYDSRTPTKGSSSTSMP